MPEHEELGPALVPKTGQLELEIAGPRHATWKVDIKHGTRHTVCHEMSFTYNFGRSSL